MLPIVGGSAAGSRLGSGRDLPFSYGEHYDVMGTMRGRGMRMRMRGIRGSRRVGWIYVFFNMLSVVSKSNLTPISFYPK